VYIQAQSRRIGMVLDNGCKRNVAGSLWHNDMQAMLRTKGLQPVRLDMREEFMFGSDRIDL